MTNHAGDLKEALEKVSTFLSSLTYDESSKSERCSLSLNKLLQMLSVILYRSVSIENIEDVKRKWSEVSEIFDTIGFARTESISKVKKKTDIFTMVDLFFLLPTFSQCFFTDNEFWGERSDIAVSDADDTQGRNQAWSHSQQEQCLRRIRKISLADAVQAVG